MLQGKQLILATKPFAKENRAKSWFYTISTLVILIAALFGTVYNFHWTLKLACSIFAGLVIVRMFVIYHDHQHKAILDRSPLANLIFTIFGFYVLAPTGIWSASHDYHHKNNCKLFSASIGSYPIYTKHKFDNLSAGEKRHYLFIRHPLTILFGYIFTFMYGMCIKSMINRFSKNIDSLVGLILHLTYQVAVFYFLGWQTWILLCAIPHFISGAMGSYMFYAQHNFPTVTFVGNEDWTYEGAALDSSSYMPLNPFMHWVTANIGYHHIHHMNSRIPFYRLPEVWDAIPEMRNAKTTSLKPKDIWACLKLKVWDFDHQKMVGV
ncbi:MAG: fatty acid desaturase [Bacteroidetes bacterium]|jgi:omega-6 fatty acid desaturase (delta-12 desaturase)|nr:fatty acid desaturase [Bacteroidota bacterium]